MSTFTALLHEANTLRLRGFATGCPIAHAAADVALLRIEFLAADKLETCPACNGSGRFLAECCSGAGGCSCGGEIVEMGPCRCCGGRGECGPSADRMANARSIAGLSYLGSDPNNGGIGA